MNKTIFSVITGLHRSGTTYIGRVLSLADDISVIHEPFNQTWGLEYAPPTYSYWPVENLPDSAEDILQNALAFKGKFLKPPTKEYTFLWQKYFFRLFGGKQHFQWSKHRFQKSINLPPVHIIWKDPFTTFMIDYLSKVHDMKCVCMIRHPCAHYYSVSKQNWNFDISYLTRQEALLEEYGEGISNAIWSKAAQDNLTSIALLWKIMARFFITCRHDKNILLVRHEDVCLNTVSEFKRICGHLNVELTPKMIQYIDKSTKGSDVIARDGKAHDCIRDSKALVDIWKRNVSIKKQESILQIVGKEINIWQTL